MTMESALFEEQQDIPVRGPLAFMSAAAFFVIPLFTKMPLFVILVMFAAGIGVSVLISSFMRMQTRVTISELTFGPNIWTRRIPAAEINVVGPQKIPFMAGVGIHRYRGKIYYNMRLGKGLEIKHGKRTYVIGSAKLEEFQAALHDQARSLNK